MCVSSECSGLIYGCLLHRIPAILCFLVIVFALCTVEQTLASTGTVKFGVLHVVCGAWANKERLSSCHVTCSCPTEVRSFLPMLSLYSCSGIVRHMDGLQSCWLGQGCIATRDELQVDTWIFNHANMGCTMELLVGPKSLLQQEMSCKLQPGLSTGRLHCTVY